MGSGRKGCNAKIYDLLFYFLYVCFRVLFRVTSPLNFDLEAAAGTDPRHSLPLYFNPFPL